MKILSTSVAIAVVPGAADRRAPSHAKSEPAKPAVDPGRDRGAAEDGRVPARPAVVLGAGARSRPTTCSPSGQKVQFGGTVDLKVRRPDRMRIDIAGDRRNERMYYDGKTFTVFGERVGYFASFPAPPTLAELKDVLEKRYAIDLPLADLFYWGTDAGRPGRDHRGDAGRDRRTSTASSCDHYAFRQKDVDWELWIEQGGRPAAAQAGDHDDVGEDRSRSTAWC